MCGYFGNDGAVVDQPAPKDEPLLAVLQERDGQRTAVVLSTGAVLRCFNIAWGYDQGDEYAHVTTNCSPFIAGEAVDFFFSSEVVRLEDGTGSCLFAATSE